MFYPGIHFDIAANKTITTNHLCQSFTHHFLLCDVFVSNHDREQDPTFSRGSSILRVQSLHRRQASFRERAKHNHKIDDGAPVDKRTAAKQDASKHIWTYRRKSIDRNVQFGRRFLQIVLSPVTVGHCFSM